MTHGHEVLHMMEGHRYASKEELVKAVEERFGADERFCTCSTSGMTASELVDFLAAKGKFKAIEAGEDAFTVDLSKVCNH